MRDFHLAGLTVSVLMPTKDRHDRLGDAVASVLEQDYPDLELVIKDASAEPWEVPWPDPRIVYVHKPDACIAEGVNQAASVATGEVLGIAQDDNTMLPGTVWSVAEALANNVGAAWTIASMIVEDETGVQRRQSPEPWSVETMVRVGNIVSEPTAWFLHTAFDEVGGMDPAWRWCQDYELWGRLGARYGAPVYRDHDDSLYRLWPGCISREHEPAMWEETHRIQAQWARLGFGQR